MRPLRALGSGGPPSIQGSQELDGPDEAHPSAPGSSAPSGPGSRRRQSPIGSRSRRWPGWRRPPCGIGSSMADALIASATTGAKLLRCLRRLDFVKGPIEIEPIAGGITNHNFVVRVGGEAYVARLCEERPLLGIDRRNEVVCQQAASERGLAPEVVHHEPGLLVSRFVEGRTLTAADVRQPQCLGRLAATLQRLHQSWDTLTGELLYFCPFQTVRTYARTAARLGAESARRDRRPARGRARPVAADRAVPPGPLPQRPAAGQRHRRRPAALAGQLGIRRHRPSALRPGQPLGQRRPR